MYEIYTQSNFIAIDHLFAAIRTTQGADDMTRTPKDIALSERLRTLIENKFGFPGRYRLLEEASGIGASKWKNFFYKKQEATSEQIEFWTNRFPEDEMWLRTGIESPNKEGFPFLADPPRRWEGQTIGDRLNWVIAEWASAKGDSLFSYLEERSYNKISADEWKKVVLRLKEPTCEMTQVVCIARPIFTEWVILGYVGSAMSVDPTNNASIEKWKKHEADQWVTARESFQKTMKTSTNN